MNVDLKSLGLALRPSKEGLNYFEDGLYIATHETDTEYTLYYLKFPDFTFTARKELFELAEVR